MNSSRTRYASTPTYGLQKRGFKKQSSVPVAETPDFTQQSMQPDPISMGGAPVAPQNGVPFSTPFFQQSLPYLQPGAGAPVYPQQPFYPGVLPQAGAPMAGMPNSVSGFSPLLPTQTAIPPTAQAATELPLNQQGYVPLSQQPILGNTVIPAATFGQLPPTPGFGQQPMMPPMQSMQPGAMPGTAPMAGAAFPPMISGSPMMMGMQQPMGAPGQPGYDPMQQPTQPRQRRPLNKDMLAKLFIFAFLPLLFVLSLVLSQFVFLKYLFLILAVLTVGAIWYLQLFSSSTRATISIVAGALCLAAVLTLSGGTDGKTSSAITLGETAAPDASVVNAQALPASEPEPLAEPEPDDFQTTSEAERRLSAFMDLWEAGLTSDMVDLVMPSWTTTKDDPASELFTTVLNNRTPTEYAIESIDGNEADSTRTVTMAATISKNNGKDPIRYRFKVLMVKEDSLWYVDPNSLASNEATESASTKPVTEPTLNQDAPRTTVTPVPDASTKLYYNATGGGKYYHIDPECSSVNEKWLPLDSFLYSQLGETPYKSLIPCLKCGAPSAAEE